MNDTKTSKVSNKILLNSCDINSKKRIPINLKGKILCSKSNRIINLKNICSAPKIFRSGNSKGIIFSSELKKLNLISSLSLRTLKSLAIKLPKSHLSFNRLSKDTDIYQNSNEKCMTHRSQNEKVLNIKEYKKHCIKNNITSPLLKKPEKFSIFPLKNHTMNSARKIRKNNLFFDNFDEVRDKFLRVNKIKDSKVQTNKNIYGWKGLFGPSIKNLNLDEFNDRSNECSQSHHERVIKINHVGFQKDRSYFNSIKTSIPKNKFLLLKSNETKFQLYDNSQSIICDKIDQNDKEKKDLNQNQIKKPSGIHFFKKSTQHIIDQSRDNSMENQTVINK